MILYRTLTIIFDILAIKLSEDKNTKYLVEDALDFPRIDVWMFYNLVVIKIRWRVKVFLDCLAKSKQYESIPMTLLFIVAEVIPTTN